MFCLFLLHVIFYFFEYFTFRLSSRLIFSITTLYKFLFELIIIFFNCKTWIVCRNCKRGSLQPWHNILQCEVLFLHVRWYNNTAKESLYKIWEVSKYLCQNFSFFIVFLFFKGYFLTAQWYIYLISKCFYSAVVYTSILLQNMFLLNVKWSGE